MRDDVGGDGEHVDDDEDVDDDAEYRDPSQRELGREPGDDTVAGFHLGGGGIAHCTSQVARILCSGSPTLRPFSS